MRNKCECPVDQRSHQAAYEEGLAEGRQYSVDWVNAVDVRKTAMKFAVDTGTSDVITRAYQIEQFLLGKTETIPSAKS